MKYRKKPLVIDAYKLHSIDCLDCPKWLRELFNNLELCELHADHITIKTLEGWMIAQKGDYIIKGIKDEIYPCKPDIFEASYERVEE
jgi:hypothetical protein